MTAYPYSTELFFLDFQCRFFANQAILIDILQEQFLYDDARRTDAPRDCFDFYIDLIHDSRGDASWNTALKHRFDPDAGCLQLSYLDDAIRVTVEYTTRKVTAVIMERALAYRAALSNWIVTIPLSELLKCHDLYLIHAACLAKDTGGILFAGRSGSGKTTLSIGLLSEGWQLVSDDETFLEGESGFRALGGPEKAKVSWNSWRRFTYYLGATERFNGKRIIRLGDYFPGQIRERLPVAAICFVEQSERIALHTIDPVQTYQKLLSVAFLNSEPGLTRRNNDFLYRLSRILPAYRLSGNLDFHALDRILTKMFGNPE
ncbi:MAG: hypothetical protein ACP5FZ_04910 [Fidelibacterota bacterium]